MSRDVRHYEWLSLLEISGPFLSVEVLREVLPQGLETVDASLRKRLGIAFDEWEDALYGDDPDFDALHRAWIDMVLSEALGYDERECVKVNEKAYRYEPAGYDASFHVDMAIVKEGEKIPSFLVRILPPSSTPDSVPEKDGWPATTVERMTALCRAVGVRFGLVTNGERWTLVNAPAGSVASTVTWYARLWFQEPDTLRAFTTLLGVRRLYGPDDERLEAMIDATLERQEEVTVTLGEQVRRAVEVLVQALDRADEDRNRELLRDVESEELYEAALTVMMRLVFLLSAEERSLLPLGDPLYDQHYAVSGLRAKLEEERDRHGAEVLERRYDAWSRLLALFRAVYDGVEHESMRMPALGGSLFDPDRFPFLEGRSKGSRWKEENAEPLPIDNRTVLLALRALQILERSGGVTKLSYKGLDVEQIGHVYEGLLDYTVRRVHGATLGLKGSSKIHDPTVGLEDLERWMDTGVETAAKKLKDLTGRSLSALQKELSEEVDDTLYSEVLQACDGDTALADRVAPFAHLLRRDAWGEFVVYGDGSFAVVPGGDRAATGAHYTPKSLTEAVVATTLEPVLYEGPAEGRPKEEWRLRSAREILDLKICDPAMGSGAFLVQVCRYLAERLVEAWNEAEREGYRVTIDGEVKATLMDEEPMVSDIDERLLVARRLVAERCLYGVDLNPMAVELAKLSIWLVTLAKDRPFGFLDHAFKVGDSLLGVEDIRKLETFSMDPDRARPTLFAPILRKELREVLNMRKTLREIAIRDIEDVREMGRIDAEAERRLAALKTVADAFVGEVLRTGGKTRDLVRTLEALSAEVAEALEGDHDALARIEATAKNDLSIDLPEGAPPRKPFHWALEFPEVFVDADGFDAIVGNPPFLGGRKITSMFGKTYRDYLVENIAKKDGAADLVAYFFLRAYELLKHEGLFGLLATNTIAEGITREVGLKNLLEKEDALIVRAYPNERWPGNAAVVTSRIHLMKSNEWKGSIILNENNVSKINSFLTDEDDRTPTKLKNNHDRTFQGCITRGTGFILDKIEGERILDEHDEYEIVVQPFMNGRDFTSSPVQQPSRYVINFWDWPLDKAKNYPIVLSIVEERVKPVREERKEDGSWRITTESIRKLWWQFEHNGSRMFHAIGRGNLFEKHPAGEWPKEPFKKVCIIPRVSKMLTVALISNTIIFSDAVVVIAYEKFSYFALLQSAFHNEWTWKNASTLETRLRYTPSDCFETFPFPVALHPDWRQVDFDDPVVAKLETIGERYHENRRKIMLDRWIGLTDLYNLFHDPTVKDHDIEELRRLHVEMDEAVKEAYGWIHLDLEHGFHEVPYLPEKDRIRFTVSEKARLEILKRLLDLNEERHRKEVEEEAARKKGGGKRVKRDAGGLF
ncbi:Eco57I restriction-modification methylase domain-containing protein [Hydrogenimonas urashimensis]|uniref:Eco57I restriction-modification methylase domain-containing protein n=1 Tax=Hydrogenimonas urashimensis TaxID=2740515 RepID=UPI00191631B8|nr:DNA methyltransferase [Hydrogenimonas urashimensis]